MKLGLLVNYTEADLALLQDLKFESCELLVFPDNPLSPTKGATRDDWEKARDRFDSMGVEVSCVGSYTNNLDPDPTQAQRNLEHLERLFDVADAMGCSVIGTFAGRDPGRSIHDNLPGFKSAFTPLVQKAEDRGLQVAIEHCPMIDNWQLQGTNFAYTPEMWELMFDAIPSRALGLEYDPSHLACLGIDYVKAVSTFGERIYHVHAKDAEVPAEALQKYGWLDPRCWKHRMPGLGQVNWERVISELGKCGYRGNIDIEGRHDPVYFGEREAEGLKVSVAHLRHLIHD